MQIPLSNLRQSKIILTVTKNRIITVFTKQQYAVIVMEQINDDQVLDSFIS